MITLYKSRYRIYTLFITAIIFIIALLPIGGGNIALAQINIKNAYEDSNVLSDLQSSKDFNLSEYPYDENLSARCINFAEFCYAVNKSDRKDYGLYLYIYNPSGKQIRDSGLNKAQLAVLYNTDGKAIDYDKFTLKLCSYSEGEQAYKFYKFRIVDHIGTDGKKIEERVNAESRRYEMSSFEILYQGDNTVSDCPVGGTYIYTGFAAGYGADKTAASTLKCAVKESEYIEIKGLIDRQTVYRTDMSNPNMTSHNQINSVYFSVPNKILEKYGKLQKVECEWWEYRTEPIIVTNNQELYNALLSMRGKNFTEHNCDYSYGLGIYKEGTANGNYKRYSWGYNIKQLGGGTSGIQVDSVCPYLNWVLPSSVWGESLNNYAVESDKLLDYIYKFDGQLSESDNGYQYCTDLLNKNVGNGRTGGYNRKNIDLDEDAFDFTQYNPTYTGWDALKHAFGWNTSTEAALTGQAPIICIDSDNVSEKLAGNNSDISARLFIDENDVAKFKTYCHNETAQGNTVVLLRFACTEYTSTMLDVFKYAEHTIHAAKITDNIAFVAQENVFLNFDVMTLTFNDNGKYMVIPVVMSPINIVSNIYGPAADVNDNTPYWLIVVMLLGVAVAAIIATIIAYKLVYFVIDAITDLFTPSYSSRHRRR